MDTYIILLSFSGLGSIAIITRNFFKFRGVLNSESNIRGLNNHSIFRGIEKYISAPLKQIWDKKIIPFFYKEIEKFGRKFRIYILKAENKIFQFNNYIKGRRIIKENGTPSEYVQKLNGFKQDKTEL